MPPKSSQKSGKGSQRKGEKSKGEKSKSFMDQQDSDSGPGSGSDTDGDDSGEASGSGDSSDEEEEELLEDTDDPEVSFNVDVFASALGLDHSNVGGACGSASDLPDPKQPGTSRGFVTRMETDAGEQYDGDVSDVQESKSQPSQPRRSDTGLSRMRSESGQSH